MLQPLNAPFPLPLNIGRTQLEATLFSAIDNDIGHLHIDALQDRRLRS